MISKQDSNGLINAASREQILYIKQMLGELSHVARAQNADMLVYLLEMAFTEATDILSEKTPLFSLKVERDQSSGMAMKPSGKV